MNFHIFLCNYHFFFSSKIKNKININEEFIAEQVEKNLLLIGATALEDRLQDKVPETIENLLKASKV